ncbi:MAG: transketolase family protein, partial [Bulleidia sp.]|nr:transketolase family protein [Bulleidia sp.]
MKATREAYGEEIAKLVQENPRIVVLDADLAGSTKSAMAQKVAPERFFDVGIAEQNLIGVSAGLA